MDCPLFGRHFPASRRGGFERLGTDAANMAVAAGSVVEDLDIVEDVGWASPAELARLLLMRRVPRPLNVDLDDLPRLRVLGAIFPDFDRIVASNDIPLPSAGKPILPIGLRHFLLAAVANVTQIGFEMLETLQSQPWVQTARDWQLRCRYDHPTARISLMQQL